MRSQLLWLLGSFHSVATAAALKPTILETHITTVVIPQSPLGDEGQQQPTQLSSSQCTFNSPYKSTAIAACFPHGLLPRRDPPRPTTVTPSIVPVTSKSHETQGPSQISSSSRPAGSASPAPTSLPPVDPKDACWATEQCDDVFLQIQICFVDIGNALIPNDIEQSRAFQPCLCKSDGVFLRSTALLTFKACLQQGGLSDDITNEFILVVQSFCLTKLPSLYLFVVRMLDFLKKAHAPPSFHVIHGPITDITTLSSVFTWSSGLNEAPTTLAVPTSAAATATTSSNSIIASTINSTSPTTSPTMTSLPTELLAQLPPKWPYTKYGVVRRPGQTTTYTLTDPHVPGSPVAILIHSLMWYPRPLNDHAKTFRDKLADWKHTMLPTSASSKPNANLLNPRSTSESSLGVTTDTEIGSASTTTGMSSIVPGSICLQNGKCMPTPTGVGGIVYVVYANGEGD